MGRRRNIISLRGGTQGGDSHGDLCGAGGRRGKDPS